MEVNKYIMLANRLEKLRKHLGRQARKKGISCYRLYDHDLPEFPVYIEWYGNQVYVAEYQRRHGMEEQEYETWKTKTREVIGEILKPEGIYFRLRQKKQGRTGQYRKLSEESREFVVEEAGSKFLVNLSDYLDTGLFLDHRDTRELVRKEASGKRVLNLFCYTGAFSVQAAAGGAASIVSVDLSRTYLDWAKKNMALNGFTSEGKYSWVQADVMEYLNTVEANSYDIIILDPPTFSNSKRMDDVLDVQRDHPLLINKCLKLLRPEGKLYFSTNKRAFEMQHSAINTSRIKDITQATLPFDFSGSFSRYCFLLEPDQKG